MCVASCSGQAIFLVDGDTGDGYGTVTLPYEFLPIPEKGTKGVALGRDGHEVCEAEVVNVRSDSSWKMCGCHGGDHGTHGGWGFPHGRPVQ